LEQIEDQQVRNTASYMSFKLILQKKSRVTENLIYICRPWRCSQAVLSMYRCILTQYKSCSLCQLLLPEVQRMC